MSPFRTLPVLAGIAMWMVVAGWLPAPPATAQDPPDQPQTRPQPGDPDPEPDPDPDAPDDRPLPVEEVYLVTSVDRHGNVVHIDAGQNQGVVGGMRFLIRRGEQEICRTEVTWALEDSCVSRVIPGSRLGDVQARDTAVLMPYVPPPRAPEGADPPPIPVNPAGNGGTVVPDPERNPLEDEDVQTLIENVRRLERQNAGLIRQSREQELELNEAVNRALAAEENLAHARQTAAIRQEQYNRLNLDMQQSITLGFGGWGGTTIGDPLFGSFSIGPERFAAVAGGNLDAFGHGLIDGMRLWFELVEQPGFGPSSDEDVLRASFGMEVYLPLRPNGWDTALVIGYHHHHFPVPFTAGRSSTGFTDGGEIVISWGRRVPMTRQREAQSFWNYTFRPIVEWIHAPYAGATGTDIRVGVGFPDLIQVVVNFNWSYFTDSNRFGALHASARIPVVQDHGDLGSFRLIVTGDWVLPFNGAAYDHVLQAGIILEFNYGR